MSPLNVDHSQIRTVAEYLRQLRVALEGAPPGLIQDALADAEDYLREEVEIDSFKPESEVMARVIKSFGTPQDVAAEYRAVEQRFERRQASRQPDIRYPGLFGVVVDWRTYAALVYALLALPLGIFYFTWVVTGVSLSAGFAILIIGVPFMLAFILSVRLIALVEGRIVEIFLGRRMPRRMASHIGGGGIWPRIKTMLLDRRTWTAMGYMFLQMPLGIFYFVTTVVGLAVSLALILVPTGLPMFSFNARIDGVRVHINNWYDPDMQLLFQKIDPDWLREFLTSPAGPAVMVLVGFALLLGLLHALRAMGWAHGRYAEMLLVRV